MPAPVVTWIRHSRLRLWELSLSQANRFAKYYARPTSRGKVQIESQLMFNVHQVEKGLSHSNIRLGFGQRALRELSGHMQRLQQVDSSYASNPLYREALTVLGQYEQRHRESGFDLKPMHSLFPESIRNEISEIGSNQVIAQERTQSQQHTYRPEFFELVNNRHAVREFSQQQVTISELNEVVGVAVKSPSVCNRQSTRVHIILGNDKIQQALRIQGGLNGYPTPPALVLITADLRAFLGQNERNQGYVDGGLFAMTFLYGLEAKGLAACPLHTMFPASDSAKTRKLLNIPENEILIMFIAVGHFLDSVPVCRSKRYSADHITSVIDMSSESVS
ncbi:nitroreductase family protein [Bifidobacterium sp.]|uniref:nitroreductase family protein n=1 Tax=Bifidobacterium sp. TaxID=41200 RepID=UPI0039E9C479